MTQLPLSIRYIKPDPAAVLITGTRPDGLPDGTHTGGAWLVGNMVYKPLDCRPYINAEFCMPTHEDLCLEEMAGQPLFPKNWNVQTINNRRFLVRQKAYVLGKDFDARMLENDIPLQVENSIRSLNRAGWTINDDITLAFGSDGVYFILDLSNAHKGNLASCDAEDWRVTKWLKENGFVRLALFRSNAQKIVFHNDRLLREYPNHRYIYASFNRPISGLWANIPNAQYIHNDYANWELCQPHTWIATPIPLPDELISRYELTFGWSPWFD